MKKQRELLHHGYGVGFQLKTLTIFAVMFYLIFPPIQLPVLEWIGNWWFVAYFALIPLTLLAVRSTRFKLTVFLTFVVSYVLWLILMHWLTHVTLAGYIALSAYLALYPVLYVCILRLIHHRARIPMTFSVPLVWVGLEYLRGAWMADGFPWFLLGHSQPIAMIQIADTFGAYGVSFVVGMASGLICELLTQPLMVQRKGAMRKSGTLRWSLPIWGVVMLSTLSYGFVRLTVPVNFDGKGSKLRIGLVQTNVPQSNKDSRNHQQNLNDFGHTVKITATTIEQKPKPDLVVWPETMVPRSINDETVKIYRQSNSKYSVFRDVLDEIVKTKQVPLLVGAHAHVNWQVEGEHVVPQKRYNAAYLLKWNNNLKIVNIERYDKIHRVPFGEYVPWVDTLPWAVSILNSLTPEAYKYENYTLTPGRTYKTMQVTGRTAAGKPTAIRIATPICYEDIVSYVPRKMVYGPGGHKRVDILINLSNDNWYAGTSEARQHEQMARFRCIENRVPMARAVNGGISGFIDSLGRIISQVEVDGKKQGVSGFLVDELEVNGRNTLFGRIGDAFAMTCLVLTTVLLIIGLLRRAQLKREGNSDLPE